jgi:AcrR family transcriptional regulator
MPPRRSSGSLAPGTRAAWHDEPPDFWDDALAEVARKLLTSAVHCFAVSGYHGTTTRDITAGVGLSPAALYVHFPSKELVLFEIIRTGHVRALAALHGTERGDAMATLRQIVTRFVAWHARHHVTGRVCQYELSGLTAEHYDEIRAIRQQINTVFREAVAAGVADGSFAAVDVNRVVRGIMSLGIDLVRWYRLDGADSPEELGEFYADLALSMVSSPSTATLAGKPARRTRPAS